MDFDTQFSAITDKLSKMKLPYDAFTEILPMLYRAYYIGKAEAAMQCKEHAVTAAEFIDITIDSALKQLAK